MFYAPRKPAKSNPKQRFKLQLSDEEARRQRLLIDKQAKIANDPCGNPLRKKAASMNIARIRAQHKASLEAEAQAADEKCWGPVEGEMLDRWHVMEYLVVMVEAGYSLPESVRLPSDSDPAAVMPNLAQVARWRKFHSEFDAQLSEAEQARGMRLGEQAISEIEALPDAPTREQVNKAKALSEVKAKAAARLNAKYQDKSVSVNEKADPLDGLTLDQLREKAASLIRANPTLAGGLGRVLMDGLSDDGDSSESVTMSTGDSDE